MTRLDVLLDDDGEILLGSDSDIVLGDSLVDEAQRVVVLAAERRVAIVAVERRDATPTGP